MIQTPNPAFKERHDEIVARAPKHPTLHLWYRAIAFGKLVFFASLLYLYFEYGEFSLRMFNNAFADAGFILIGVSFLLSSLCYFFDMFDTKIIYRKYIGIVGFYLVFVHFVISLLFVPYPASRYLHGENLLPFIAALGSLAILTGMYAISNRYSAAKLGGVKWRMLLRTGYAAYLLAIIHFALKKRDEWSEWFQGNEPLPPLSIFVIIFGIFVLLMRLMLQGALFHKKLTKPKDSHGNHE